MGHRNNGRGEMNALQNQFTAYLQSAVRRKKRDYMAKQLRISGHELAAGFQDTQFPDDALDAMDRDTNSEDLVLMEALAGLSARERYILFEHILNERSYDALAKPLGLRYSGVSAAYHRIIQKLRKELGGK